MYRFLLGVVFVLSYSPIFFRFFNEIFLIKTKIHSLACHMKIMIYIIFSNEKKSHKYIEKSFCLIYHFWKLICPSVSSYDYHESTYWHYHNNPKQNIIPRLKDSIFHYSKRAEKKFEKTARSPTVFASLTINRGFVSANWYCDPYWSWIAPPGVQWSGIQLPNCLIQCNVHRIFCILTCWSPCARIG